MVWGFLRTTLCWLTFGLFAFIWGLLLIPVTWRERGTAGALRAQAFTNWGLGHWVRFSVLLGAFRVTWENPERMGGPGPRILVANHPTLIDAPLILARRRDGFVVVGDGYARALPLRRVVAAADYVVAGRHGSHIVTECVERLGKGQTLLIFPEGTRSPVGGLGGFQRGAAHIALRSGCEVVPISVTVKPPILHKEHRWYNFSPARGEFHIRVLPPLRGERFDRADRSRGVNAREMTAELRRILLEGVLEQSGDEAEERG